ncbi:MAG: hypothetical protein ACJA1W_000537 [Akkermansiaceae bacterium]
MGGEVLFGEGDLLALAGEEEVFEFLVSFFATAFSNATAIKLGSGLDECENPI